MQTMPYFWLSNNVCLQRSLQRITETTEPAEPQPDLRMELLGRLPAILSGPAVEKLHGCHLYYLCYYRSITSRYEQERFPTPLLLGLPFEKSNDVKETIWKASLPGARTLLGAPGIATNGAFLLLVIRLDSDLAPPGHHVVHAYTPATEPWEDWAPVDPSFGI